MSEVQFVEGMFIDKPNDNAPEWVKGKLSVNGDFVKWYEANKNDKGYVNIDIKEGKSGKWYVSLNDWKPDASLPTASADTSSDMPF